MGEELAVEYRPLSEVVRWERNPKRHDLEVLVESFQAYGFKDPIKHEPLLNGGSGGIIEGNGRSHALEMMRDLGMEAPRGVKVEGGEWMVPVLLGVDARSEREAESYGVDHNAIGLLGTPLSVDELYPEGALQDLDIETLVEFELDSLEGIPDEAEMDADMVPQESGEFLKFGKVRVPLNDGELSLLVERHEAYLGEFGMSDGFVSWLFEE